MSLDPGASVFADRVIVVLGNMRSGTSWLVELLGAHPDIGTTRGESWIFNSLWSLWMNAHSPADGPSTYLDPAYIAAAMRRFCDGLFATALARQAPGATWFVEKTPGHVARVPIMAETHPDAWYIHIVRDGRDVARSLLNVSWGPDEPGRAAATWVSGIRNFREQAWRLERLREIRYEDLLADPVGEVGGLLNWMGLDVDATVEGSIRERAAQEVSRYSATEAVGAGKWRDLPTETLERIYEEAGDLLLELGYADGPDGLRRGPSAGSA